MCILPFHVTCIRPTLYNVHTAYNKYNISANLSSTYYTHTYTHIHARTNTTRSTL